MGKKNGVAAEYSYSTSTGNKITNAYQLWERGQLIESTRYFIIADHSQFVLEYIRKPDGSRRVYWPGTTKLCSQTSYFRNKRHGSHTEYNQDGTLKLSEMYADGKLVGRDFGTAEPFNNGVTDGWRKFYNKNGDYLYKCRYARGQFIENTWSREE